MRTRQEQTDDTLLQRARLRAGWTFDELGERLGVSGATAERYCLEDGNGRAIKWMGPVPAGKLEALQLRAEPEGEICTVFNFRDLAEPAPPAKRRRR
jgi:hypothetical protein